jgi:serine/threonine-protein kinase
LLREWATQHCQRTIPSLPLECRHYQCIVDKALAKRLDNRYQNMEEVLSDLETL